MQSFLEGGGFTGDGVHQRPALDAREHLGIDAFGKFLLAEDDSGTGAAQGLMGGGSHHIGIRNGAHVQSRCHQSGNMRHIHQQFGAHGVCNLAETGEIHLARISRSPHQDELGLVLFCHLGNLGIVKLFCIPIDIIVDDMVKLPTEGKRMAMGEVTAVGEFQGQHRIAGFHQAEIGCHVGLGTAVGLHIGVFRPEQLLGAFDGQALHFIDVFAATVISAIEGIVRFAGLLAPAVGIALGVFIGEHTALGFHHRQGGEIFGGDQFQVLTLAFQLRCHGGIEFGIIDLDVFQEVTPSMVQFYRFWFDAVRPRNRYPARLARSRWHKGWR